MTASSLIKIAWRIFAIDVALGALLIIAAVTESGDAAGRGLAEVYAVGCVIALLACAGILGLSTYLRSTIGLWLSIGLMVTPPILFIIGIARRVIARS